MKGTKVYYRLHKKDMEHGSMFSTKGLKFTPNVTHVQVGLCPSEWDKEEIFEYFNIGKGVRHISDRVKATPDLTHTSMSVGDVVVTEDDQAFACDGCGWKELIKNSPNFIEVWQ